VQRSRAGALARPPAAPLRRPITTVTDVARTRAAELAARAAALALAFSAACGGLLLGGGDRPPAPLERGLHLWAPTLLHWDAGADRHLEFVIENGTPRTVTIAEPDPAYARVAVFPGPDNLRVCGVEPRPAAPGARRRIAIPPGGSVAVRVDLGEACAGVAAGEYRFEVDYRSPPVEGAEAFTGGLATRYGELLVEGAPQQAHVDPSSPRRAGRAPPRR
jgi:hypothetical protein